MHQHGNHLRSLVTLGLTIGLAGSFAAPAAAQQPVRYKRATGKVEIKVKQTERTSGIRPKNTAKKPAMPEITADAYLNIATAVKAIRQEQITSYRELIEDTPKNSPDLPDLLFRLAEVYAEQERYWHFQAMELYAKIDKAKNKPGVKANLEAKQRELFKNEARYLTEAIKAYATLANDEHFKNYSRMDEALFYYAYTLQEAKRIDVSRVVFQKLIKDYPGSKYLPFAFLAFADFFFDQQDLARAEKFYDKVLEFPKAPIYNYALYKKGWVYLNQKREQDALETFYDVAQKTKGKTKYVDLNKAAKKDFVRAYAEIGKAELALKAFERVDKDYAFNMLKILAGIYLEQGKAEKAIYTYRELIGIAPKDPAVCEWQTNVTQAMMTVGDNARKAEEAEKLVKLYDKYRDKNVLKGDQLAECKSAAQDTIYELAGFWHQEMMRTQNFDNMGLIEKLYSTYVDNFTSKDDTDRIKHDDVQFFMADVMWLRAENEQNARVATERWEKVAQAFADVVKAGGLDPARRKDAALAAVLGWKNALAIDPRSKVKTVEVTEVDIKGKIPAPQPIDPREQKMIAAFDVYMKYIEPKDPELVEMKFLKGVAYWHHEHLEEAIPMFQEIVEKYPEHERAEESAGLVLDSLIRLHKFAELNAYADDLASRKKAWLADKDELRKHIADIRAVGKRTLAQDLEKKGDHIKCGKAYDDIYNDNPTAPKMDEVIYSAGVCYEDGRSIGLAIQRFSRLIELFPTSNLAQKAQVRIGNAYGAAAFYQKAADAYEKYAKKYGGEKDAAGALQNAVTYRKGIGDDKQAVDNIEFFVKQYKNKLKKDAADALFGMVGIYEKQGNQEAVLKHLERYLREMGAAGGRDRVIIAHAKMGQILWERSCKGKGVDGACIKVERQRALRTSGKRRKGTVLPARCGEASKIKLTVIKRDPSNASQAQRHFRTALAEQARGAGDGVPEGEKEARVAAATHFASGARFYLADAEYEKFLAIEFPEKLDFTEKKKKDSTKRFLKWQEEKGKAGKKVNDLYNEVKNKGSAAWAIAAAARMAQISQNYADQLYTAEVPTAQRTGEFAEDKWDNYCDALMTVATPLEEHSVAGFTLCLEESTKRNWFNTWSRLCERELGQIRPGDFPTASELHAEPTMTSPVTDTQGLVTNIRI